MSYFDFQNQPAMAKATAKKTAPKKNAAKKTNVKKAASKKAVKKTTTPAKSSKKEYSIKYEDKSAGQPKLVHVFKELVKLMDPFAKGSIQKLGGKDGQASLVSKEPAEVNGRKMDEVWFSGALVQKGYVGFYFMPVYMAPELKSELHPELLKCLKGKSCFHIKKMDEEVAEQVKEALEKGYDLCKKKGWVR
ncbi:MAG: hypothetical protein K0Q66_2314 [Chitinophagaceae bacterium]|nr:hypothetical protein [Chitinophagaceae bacterium]